jgi:hypothetical protein
MGRCLTPERQVIEMSAETTDIPDELKAPPGVATPFPRPAVAFGGGVPFTAGNFPKGEASSMTDAFAPPLVETLDDGTELRFPMITMDDWAETSSQLEHRRRERAKSKLQLNLQLTPQDRELILLRLDDEPMTFMATWVYRVRTADGIRNGLVKQLVKGNQCKPQEAAALIRRLSPIRQKEIMEAISDPPKPPKPDTNNPNGQTASELTNETGQSMPDSSNESSQESDLGV